MLVAVVSRGGVFGWNEVRCGEERWWHMRESSGRM